MKTAALALFALLVLILPATAADLPLLVDVEALRAHLADPDLRIVDMTDDLSGYRRGHIPGAVYLTVNDARVAVKSGGYRLPTPEEAARLFARLGITPSSQVVIYDDAGGLDAARLFFTLESFGHRRVAILDGGAPRWRAAGGAWTADASQAPRPAEPWTPRLDADRVASAEWIRDHLATSDVSLVDARTPEEYAGTDVRARRGGHIPGAVNVDWRRHLRRDGTFKSLDDLRAMYVAAGITPDKTVVTYCQTQHRASHTYFVLRLLGYPRVAGYDRSWSEWGNREDLPLAR
jgi:thiosulfate/3-mercaptopyruvate sulfurtransferase